MSGFIGRSALVCGLLLVLSGCQSAQQPSSEPNDDVFAATQLMFDQHIANQQLDLAGQQLEELSLADPAEPRLAELQQRLANAWLAVGEQALQKNDVETASAALIQAKRLLPQAPALTEGLSAALAAAAQPAVADTPVEQPAPVKRQAARQKPTVTVPSKTDAEEQAEAKIEQPTTDTDTSTAPKPRRTAKARVIDANAPYSIIPMPMLNNRNNHQLGRLLDAVAVDVVRFRATVSIEVADTRDFHWVAALLSARVKKIDSNFKPRLKEVIRNEEPAQLIITPNSSF